MNIEDLIIGFIIGDSFGLSRLNNYNNENLNIIDNKILNIKKGNYSFNTINLLATIDSISNTKKIDYTDIINKLCLSLITNKYCFNKIYDLDKETYNILTYYSKKNNLNYKYNENDLMGTPLTRVIPIIIYNYYNIDTLDTLIPVINITNINEEVLLGSFIYYKYILNLLEGYDKYKALKIDIPNYFSIKNKIKYKNLLKNNIFYKDIVFDNNISNILKIIFYVILNSDNNKDVLMMLNNLNGKINLYGALIMPIAIILYGEDEYINNLYKDIKNKKEIKYYINKFRRMFK